MVGLVFKKDLGPLTLDLGLVLKRYLTFDLIELPYLFAISSYELAVV